MGVPMKGGKQEEGKEGNQSGRGVDGYAVFLESILREAQWWLSALLPVMG